MAARNTTFDWVLEAVSLAALIGAFALLAARWGELPTLVPRHFGIQGVPNRWGDRDGLLFLPIISAGIYVLLTIAGRVPSLLNVPFNPLLNVPFKVDRDSPAVRRELVHMTSLMKAEIMLASAYITWASVQTALAQADGLGRAFVPIFAVALLGSIAFFLLRLSR